jgi:hypothetical protein
MSLDNSRDYDCAIYLDCHEKQANIYESTAPRDTISFEMDKHNMDENNFTLSHLVLINKPERITC